MSRNRKNKNISNGSIWKNFLRLMEYGKTHKLLLAFTIFLGLLVGVFQLLVPLQIAKILDAYVVGNYKQVQNISILAVIYIFSFVAELILGRNVAKLSNRISSSLRGETFAHLTELPTSFYDRSKQGDVISRLTNDVQAVAISIQNILQEIFSGVVILIGAVILMLRMDLLVASLVILLTPISFFITSSIAFASNKLFLEQSKVTGEIQAYSEEMITGQKVIRAFAAEDKTQAEYDKLNEQLYEVGQKAQFVSSLTNPGTRLVNNITYIVVGVMAIVLAAKGEISVGAISAFLTYALQYAKPVNQIAQVMTEIQAGLASSERIFEILDLESLDSEIDKPELTFYGGNIEFTDLSFAYEKHQKLIENLNLSVKSGQTVAIVGPTGAGKTTLVNLLMRFYEPQKGAIYLDSQDIAEVKRDSVRSLYGMVLQETWLLRSSIFDNIAYGKSDGKASEAEVIEAAKKAQAHDFIMQLEEGYQTKLASASANLSTGQKQLLTLARVFISKPDMLILDEATSDIDTRTEILVQKAFAELMKGKTSFIIAHRLSTIKNADLILVMNQGDVVEVGTHDELIEKEGFYYNLFNSQFA
ncbi:ABC transporter ATP-binding protein [Fastidiosipila sanguinis]|uniref:Sugar ABC transporter ATP-binding protein n=1 Tax=Fastidiosipila sanguinis TaxID=236753 RepID=A0A2S0KMY4_9FIRM|nr:ABC transporter ATP-binding protein [Fastidiosipila sanguinis]AVM42383.1 sugar ABC transporter ATP-binding protein [Fastidiosipila sanguinis]